MITLDDFLSRLQDVHQVSDNEWSARCPAHEDDNPSLSVSVASDGKIKFFCHAECDWRAILGAMNLKLRDVSPSRPGKDNAPTPSPVSKRRGRPPGSSKSSDGRMVATYDYADEQGNVLFQVCRFEFSDGRPKEFRQRHREITENSAKWAWNLKGVRKVLYRLPGVLEAVQAGWQVFLVEGEKDVHTCEALGFTATTNPAGGGKGDCRGKWLESYSEALRGAHVILCTDNDESGEGIQRAAARSLRGKAASLRVLKLPGLPPKGDISDWAAAGGTREQLDLLLPQARSWEDVDRLPRIAVNGRPWREVINDSLSALTASNDPPSLFVQQGRLVTIQTDEANRPSIVAINESGLQERLAQAADYIRVSVHGGDMVETDVPPPMDATKAVHARGMWPMPPLVGIIETPSLRPDGSIISEPGYDPRTRLYYHTTVGLTIPEIGEHPDEDDVATALETLREPFRDFPFREPADKANMLAFLLTPLLRPVIPGCVPMALIDAPTAGSGKSLLTGIVALVATGREPAMKSPPHDEEEARKQITSALMGSETMIVWDNVSLPIGFPSIDRVLTSSVWSDRVLGQSRQIILPQLATWAVSGNNIQLRGDLPRRVYRVRIDSEQERPWEREGLNFHHYPLMPWVLDHRGDIIAAAITLTRAWFAAGCPAPSVKPLGSFEGWTETVGGVLEHAGVEGFLGNQGEVYQDMDTEKPAWDTFISEWFDLLGPQPISVAELVKHLDGKVLPGDGDLERADRIATRLREAIPDTVATYYLDDRKRSQFPRKLGNAMKSRAGQIFSGIRLIQAGRDAHTRTVLWTLEPAQKSAGSAGSAGSVSSLHVGPQINNTHTYTHHTHIGRGESDPADPADPASPATGGNGGNGRSRERVEIDGTFDPEKTDATFVTPPTSETPPTTPTPRLGTDGRVRF